MNNEASHISQGSLTESDLVELVQRTQKGDSQAVATLYSMHYQKLYTFAYYRLEGNIPLAEDITEEAFLRAFKTIGTFKWKGVSFGAWLVTIARNLIVDLSRRPAPLQLQETLLDMASDPEKLVEQTLANKELGMALEKLTSEQKEVIILRFFDDFSIAETAKILGKSIDAIKRLQARALVVLESNLSRD